MAATKRKVRNRNVPQRERPATSKNDRVEIAFTSDVPAIWRESIIDAVTATATDGGLWVYPSVAETSGTVRLEIAAHDRAVVTMTDGAIIERLRPLARAQGITIGELLRRLANG